MSKNANTAMAKLLTPAEAVTRIAGQYPEEAKVLSAVLKKDIRVLGTDELFALTDGQGQVRAFKQSLTLSVANGGLVSIPSAATVVSAQGYEMWAEATGASVIFPKEVLVDDKWQANPAVVRDPSNRRILAIYARAVAFRFSSKGIPQVSDWTTIFDTPSYRLIDLLGKAKKYPQAFKLLPAEGGKPEAEGTWAAYPFDESTNLYVNTSHEEALTWFAQILNREKKAIDFAQTFAKRNALKHLSGIQKAPTAGAKTWKGKDGREHSSESYVNEWTLPILCWRPTSGNIVKWDATRYSQVQDSVGGLLTSSGGEFETEKIESKTGVERVSDDPGVETLEASTDPEDQEEVIDVEHQEVQPPTSGPAPMTPPQSLSDEDRKILMNYHEAREQFPVEHAQACRTLGLPVDGDFTPKQAEAVIKKVGVILDAQNIA